VDACRKAYDGNTEGWENWPTISMLPDSQPRAGPDVEAIAEQVFMALKDHLDRTARDPATPPVHETRGHHG
jgi:hypothetical protein